MKMFDAEWWRTADEVLPKGVEAGPTDWLIVGILLVILFGGLYLMVRRAKNGS